MRMLSYIPIPDIQALLKTYQQERQAALVEADKLAARQRQQQFCAVLANIFRLNTLYMVAYAGSGHIGTSFSCMDILTALWLAEMEQPNQPELPHSDTYFSSKGHDAPALYSLLIGTGRLDARYLHQLRRLGGLPGHPDVKTPYMITNTGSLGMGISKARGMAWANRLSGKQGQFFVLTGDGELQEGQFWESLQPAVNGKLGEITVIVDHNKIQSDLWLDSTSSLGALEDKLRAFGWEVARCDGHDFAALADTLAHFKTVTDRPKILIADTLKGKGVSFMEPHQLGAEECYRYHSGAPSAEDYDRALQLLQEQIQQELQQLGLPTLTLATEKEPQRTIPQAPQRLVPAYGEALVALAKKHPQLVALDGDLMLDTGLIPFKQAFRERYIECGIAEQDMVSVAGGLALRGQLPVVHSFACFLSTRPNEQIYNNATEHTKIIYTGSLAGLLPGMPGHSHQSVRDISILGSIPGLTLAEPSNEQETRLLLEWAVEQNPESSYIRLTSIPVETNFTLPDDYTVVKGQGVTLQTGKDAILFAYGPVLLTHALRAAQHLQADNIQLTVVNLPWLNTVDAQWLANQVAPFEHVFTLDNHYTNLGQGSMLTGEISALSNPKRVHRLGVESIPACGQNDEVLAHHGLDEVALFTRIKAALHEAKTPEKAGRY